jgi:coenzyme Q-binding protein COQ10
MKTLDFTRHVAFSPDDMFSLISDLESYPDFVPNCTGMEVEDAGENVKMARMSLAFGPIDQAYTSRVEFDHQARTITAEASDGPFENLDSKWSFEPEGEGTTVRFHIQYRMSNPLFAAVAEPMLAANQEEVVNAFIDEAGRRFTA